MDVEDCISKGFAVIDIRSEDAFRKLHVRGSISFPATQLMLRSGELPPRTRRLVVIIEAADSALHTVAEEEHRGDIIDDEKVTENVSVMHSARSFFERAKWVIEAFVPISGIPEHLLETGPQPAGLRYWEPSPFVLEMASKHLPAQGIALDFGCGSGRDMAYLAGLGWSCVGIDNRPKLLSQAMAMHQRFGSVGQGSVVGVGAHLKVNSPFRPSCADLVLMVRFLHRPSAAAMLATIRVGGYFLCSHFVDGVQHSTVGTPKNPDAFLKHGELIEWLQAQAGSFTILHNEETTIEDGRPVVNLLAQRTA